MTLQILEASGHRLVTPELASGEVERWSESAWGPLVSDMPRPVKLDHFDAVVDEAMEKFDRYDSEIDPWLVARLHRALPLTRREASNPGVWRYLAVVRRPELIRHRWENRSWATTRSRFWSVGLRHTSISFARLWWIAELTREGESYELTERVFTKQNLAIQLFVRGWSWYRPAIVAAMASLDEAPAETVERVARELSRYLATVPLETLSVKDLREVIVSFRDRSAA